MKILLDTHVWLWMQVEPEKIADATRELLAEGSNQLYLSTADRLLAPYDVAKIWA